MAQTIGDSTGSTPLEEREKTNRLIRYDNTVTPEYCIQEQKINQQMNKWHTAWHREESPNVHTVYTQ